MVVLPGLIQKSKADAEGLKRHIREAPDGWHLQLYENDAWVYVARFSRKRDLEDFLVGKLTQEDR